MNAVDFQIKMCKNAIQSAMLDKVFNKSYQDLDERDLKKSLEELCKIFHLDSNDEDEISPTDESEFLSKMYHFSKSVPRQIGRCRMFLPKGYHTER